MIDLIITMKYAFPHIQLNSFNLACFFRCTLAILCFHLAGSVIMEFLKITSDTDCKCLDYAVKQDTGNKYVRAIINMNLHDGDFTTFWESKKERFAGESCKTICKAKGVSVNILCDDNLNCILEKYRTTKTLRNKYGYVCIFKFKANSGLLWKSTPDYSRGDKYHYTFFKCDSFDISMINVVSILPLS